MRHTVTFCTAAIASLIVAAQVGAAASGSADHRVNTKAPKRLVVVETFGACG